MRVLKKEFTYKLSDKFIFAFLGDFHVGNVSSDIDLIKRIVERLVEDKAYVFLMGDYADAIVPDGDHRFDMRQIDKKMVLPKEQYDAVYEILKPLKGRILAVLTGNHDEMLAQRHYHDWVDELAQRLEAPYGTMCTFYRLGFKVANRHMGRRRFDILLHHGYFTGRTKSGVLKRVQDMNQMFEADLYAMGHVHQKDFATDTILTVDRGLGVSEKRRYYVLSGCFLKSYKKDGLSGYAEKRMYRPSDLGCMGIEMSIRQNNDCIEVRPVEYR